MLRVSVALALPAFLFSACGGSAPKAIYEQENFTDNQTYSRSYAADYKVACDAGRRTLLSQGYAIDRMASDSISGHKNFLDASGRNLQITFNVNCAPDNTGPNHAQVFANAVQDSFSLKKSSTAASVGVGILGSVSLPISSTDDSLVKTSSLTVTRPQFYGGFFDLLQQYLAVSKVTPPETATPKQAQPAATAEQTPVPTVPLTPENTGLPKSAPAALAPAPTPVQPKIETPAAAQTDVAPASPVPASTPVQPKTETPATVKTDAAPASPVPASTPVQPKTETPATVKTDAAPASPAPALAPEPAKIETPAAAKTDAAPVSAAAPGQPASVVPASGNTAAPVPGNAAAATPTAKPAQ